MSEALGTCERDGCTRAAVDEYRDENHGGPWVAVCGAACWDTMQAAAWIDGMAVAEAVRAAGVPVRVMDTGGSVGTILTGEAGADGRYVVAAGPLYADGAAARGEFAIGRDDDGDGPWVDVPAAATVADAAAMIVAAHRAAVSS